MEQIISRDLQHIWHPCTQMKDFETCPPLVVHRASGSYLYTDRGPLIDAISSWWCKSLGHGHPAVIAAIQDQLTQFEHVIGVNTTNPFLVQLAEELTQISQKQHVYFASDGASAVEIAMKLAIHASVVKGYMHKKQFIALKNAYHGESLGTMSVSDLGIYKSAYLDFNLSCHFIQNIPYLCSKADPLWQNSDHHWEQIKPQLDAISEQVCAVIVEPLVQGAAGMLCYSPDLLKKLASWARKNDIYLIADEIMTGIGRTGKWLACEHAGISPDLICLSKGLTSGTVPLSCVMIDSNIFDLFYGEYSNERCFLHSNTYSCNPLAVRAALATLLAMKQDGIIDQSLKLEQCLWKNFGELAKISGKLTQLRGIGGIIAADLIEVEHFDIGKTVYREALKHGALIRPIGNTLYWLPPLNIEEETIIKLTEITLNSIHDAYAKGI